MRLWVCEVHGRVQAGGVHSGAYDRTPSGEKVHRLCAEAREVGLAGRITIDERARLVDPGRPTGVHHHKRTPWNATVVVLPGPDVINREGGVVILCSPGLDSDHDQRCDELVGWDLVGETKGVVEV